MPRYLPDSPNAHNAENPSPGILLVNMGSPDAPTPAALRAYLNQFLSDPRIVELPPLFWQPLLKGIILNTRPRQSAMKYASIWGDEGSPLISHTEKQACLLEKNLKERGLPLAVAWAMRYGNPSIGNILTQLKSRSVSPILIIPMYPQYAASTTASVMDSVGGWLSCTRNQPQIGFIRDFHRHKAYIAALAESVKTHWSQYGEPDEKTQFLMSFHGLPKKSLKEGDPYFHECQTTGNLLAKALNLPPQQYRIVFQSRFGKSEWLEPYTADTLRALPKEGISRVDMICPGFVADCLETLEEIAMLGKQQFLQAGGKTFRYIPALNEQPAWINALSDLAEDYFKPWR